MSESDSNPQGEAQRDDQMYQVEEIRDKKIAGKKTLYLVKWLNWDRPEDMTWEPIENLNTVLDLVQKFQKKFKQRQQKNQGESTKKRKIEQSPNKNNTKYRKDHNSQQQSSSSHQKSKLKSPLKKMVSEGKQKKQMQETENKKRAKAEKQKRKQIEKRNQQIQLSSESERSSSVQELKNQKEIKESKKQKTLKLTVGAINYMIIKENGDVFYDVDIVTSKGQCIGIKLLPSEEIKRNHEDLLINFLEDYMLDQERMRRAK